MSLYESIMLCIILNAKCSCDNGSNVLGTQKNSEKRQLQCYRIKAPPCYWFSPNLVHSLILRPSNFLPNCVMTAIQIWHYSPFKLDCSYRYRAFSVVPHFWTKFDNIWRVSSELNLCVSTFAKLGHCIWQIRVNSGKCTTPYKVNRLYLCNASIYLFIFSSIVQLLGEKFGEDRKNGLERDWQHFFSENQKHQKYFIDGNKIWINILALMAKRDLKIWRDITFGAWTPKYMTYTFQQ